MSDINRAMNVRPPLARTTDPQTSHDAAASVDLTERQALVLRTMRSRNKAIDWTPDEVEAYAGTAGLWRRFNELETLGVIKATGETRPGKSGRMQRTWKIV